MFLKDRKIIVTGGPTREWIDPVRYISNASSGKMGIALADEADLVSKNVVFIHGPINDGLLNDREYRCVAVESTVDLLNAVVSELCAGSVLIMAAAPADYAPLEKSQEKMKKSSDELGLRLKKNPDILRHVAKLRLESNFLNDIFVVGFAAETHNIEDYARTKLKEKNLDMICLNDVGRPGAGFSGDTNIITIFTRHGEREDIPLSSKRDVAKRILKRVDAELEKRG